MSRSDIRKNCLWDVMNGHLCVLGISLDDAEDIPRAIKRWECTNTALALDPRISRGAAKLQQETLTSALYDVARCSSVEGAVALLRERINALSD